MESILFKDNDQQGDLQYDIYDLLNKFTKRIGYIIKELKNKNEQLWH